MADIIGQIINWLAVIMITAVVGLVIFILVMENKYKHHIIIKKVVNGATQIKKDKFRKKKDKDGIVWWKLRKIKKELVPFPNKCVGLDNKGKMFTECYQLSEETFVPIQDTFDPNSKDDYDELIKTLQPYTSSQRALVVSQHAKASRNRKKSIAEMISAAVPYISVVMIVVMFMIFYGDAVEPIKEMADTSASHWEKVTENIAKATEKLDNVINDKKVLSGEIVGINQTINPPPN